MKYKTLKQNERKDKLGKTIEIEPKECWTRPPSVDTAYRYRVMAKWASRDMRVWQNGKLSSHINHFQFFHWSMWHLLYCNIFCHTRVNKWCMRAHKNSLATKPHAHWHAQRFLGSTYMGKIFLSFCSNNYFQSRFIYTAAQSELTMETSQNERKDYRTLKTCLQLSSTLRNISLVEVMELYKKITVFLIHFDWLSHFLH